MIRGKAEFCKGLDANIVAVMQANGVKRLLTHNLDDFKKFDQAIDILGLDDVAT